MPGDDEERGGKPFTGKAGKFLDGCLADHGITREHVFLTNILRCRACNITGSKKENRPPTEEEATACLNWLDKTVKIINPVLILCLGSPATNVASNHREIITYNPNLKITKYRGTFFKSRWGIEAISSIHPSFVIRQQGKDFEQAKEWLLEDIHAAKKRTIELVKKKIEMY